MLILTRCNEFLYFDEGTGDNLLLSDKKEGYVDYIDWTLFRFENGEFLDADGGMILLKELVKTKYGSIRNAIWDVLKEAYYTENITDFKPIVLIGKEEP